MELNAPPMLRYSGQLNQPDLIPASGPTHWFLQHRDSGSLLPGEQPPPPSTRLRAEPLR